MAQRSVILELIVSDKNSAKVTSRLQKEFGAVEKSANKATSVMTTGNKQAAGATRDMNRAVSGANQTLFSFGDIVNDAQQFQFGFASGSRAIGNNIGFMAEQFSNVQTQAGGFTNALKAMGSSLLGPGGIILGINLVVTAISIFGDKLFDTGKKAKDLKKDLEELTAIIKGVSEELASRDFFGEDPFGIAELAFQQQAINQALEQTRQAQRDLTLTKKEQAELERLRLDQSLQGVEIDETRLSFLEGQLENKDQMAEIESQLLKDLKEITTELRTQQIIRENTNRLLDKRQKFMEGRRSILDRRQLQQGRDVGRAGGVEGTTVTDQEVRATNNLSSAWVNVADAIQKARKRTQEAKKANQSLLDIANEGMEEAADNTGQFEMALARAGAQAIISADNFGEAANAIIDAVLAEIVAFAIRNAIRDLPFPANLAAAVGAAAAARGLAELIPEFRHGVDDFEGGLAKVHGGEVITMLPEGANVITNQNIERLNQMKQEAAAGVGALSASRQGFDQRSLEQTVERAIMNGMRKGRFSINRVDESLGDFQDLQTRIGNG